MIKVIKNILEYKQIINNIKRVYVFRHEKGTEVNWLLSSRPKRAERRNGLWGMYICSVNEYFNWANNHDYDKL